MVSIVIPFFNAEKYLQKAVDSVIAQTYTAWELILLDDGSTDKSLEIAYSLQSLDSRIRVISDGKNMNLGHRLNQAPDLVNYEYLVRMDADDIMHPLKIEKQIGTMLEDPTIDVLGTNAYSIDDEGFVVGIRYKVPTEFLVSCKSFIHPTIMAKRSWFKNNPYDINAVRIEDAELWLRTASQYSFKMLTEPLFFYREFGKDYYKKYFKAFPSLFYLLKKHSFGVDYVIFVLKYIISSFIYLVFHIFGNEEKLILHRNQVLLSKENYNEFIKNK